MIENSGRDWTDSGYGLLHHMDPFSMLIFLFHAWGLDSDLSRMIIMPPSKMLLTVTPSLASTVFRGVGSFFTISSVQESISRKAPARERKLTSIKGTSAGALRP